MRPLIPPSSLNNLAMLRRKLFTLPDLSSLLPFNSSSETRRNHQTYREEKIFPYKPSQLYSIVADVDSYQHFVPFCTNSRVINNSQPDKPTHSLILDAELTVGFLTLKESYVSKVTCKPFSSVEAVASSHRLFKSLVTTWHFEPIPQESTVRSTKSFTGNIRERSLSAMVQTDQTLVTLDLAYAFADPLHTAISAAFFGQVSKLMVQAFERRCFTVYGTQST